LFKLAPEPPNKRSSLLSFVNCFKALSDIIKKKHGFSPKFLFGIDEFKRINLGMNPFIVELKEILNYNALNTFVIISTLDDALVRKKILNWIDFQDKKTKPKKTKSGRVIFWAPLPPLNPEDLEEKFFATKWGDSNQPTLKYLLSQCGGHPRTLQELYIVLQDKFAETSFESIFEEFKQAAQSKDLLIDPNEIEIESVLKLICQSILGHRVSLKEALDNQFSYRMLIEQSILINSLDLTYESSFIPKLQPIALQVWCEALSRRGSLQMVREYLLQALRYAKNLNDMTFENFVGIFEALKSLAFDYLKLGSKIESREMNFDNWYPGIQLAKGKIKKFKLVNFLNLTTWLTKYNAEFKDSLEPHHLDGRIILPKGGNPAFDIFQCHNSIFKFIKCKFSDVNSSTTLSPNDIWTKVSLLQTKHEFTFEQLSNSVLIFFVLRKVNVSNLVENLDKFPNSNDKKKENEFQNYQSFPGTVYIFDKNSILEWFGPTFQSCAGFHLEISQRS